MDTKPKVVFNKVSKMYNLHQKKLDTLLDIFSIKKNKKRDFYALRDISFTVNEGETIGVIGINGSGKSTLSNLLAEIVPPTSGEIKVDGETSLVAISVGLNNNLTGRENIHIKCLMHGMKKEEIKNLTPLIIDFADIGDFIDQPVKNYSSGMKSRLGFAISAHTNPDVMVIDEALSVGDQTFYDKCINKMNEFKAEGKTIFFISHSASQVRSFCDKVIWLHYGEVVEFGPSRAVIESYKNFIRWYNDLSEVERREYKKEKMAIQTQANSSNSSSSGRSRKYIKEKRGKNSNLLEIFALLFLFVISTILMFTNNDEAHTKAKIDTIEVNKDQTSAQNEKTVSKRGFISSNSVMVYHTSSLQDKMFELEFMDEVKVIKEINGVYMVESRDKSGYIETNHVNISVDQLQPTNFNLVNMLPAFPESFQSAYEYYLIFLDESSKEIEEKLNGKTDKNSDEFGNRYISYGDVTYRINPDGYSDQVIVSNIETDNVDLDELLQYGAFTSEDGQLVYIVNQDFEFILNRLNNTFIIKPRKAE